MLAHVFEEVFLIPSGEHGGGGGGEVAAIVGAEDGGLVAGVVEFAEFAQPQATCQAGAAFGFGMLWTVLVSFPLMSAIQLMCARIAMVSNQPPR